MHTVLNLLTNTNLVVRTENDLIEPKNDAIALFIDFTFGAMEGLKIHPRQFYTYTRQINMVSTIFRTQTVVVKAR